MGAILLDYAVPFNQVESLPPPSLGFLHKLGVIVKHDEGTAPPDVTLVTDPTELTALTAFALELQGAFDGGLNAIYLVRVQTADEIAALVDEKEGIAYTLYCHQSITAAEFFPAIPSWKGVKAAVTSSATDYPLATQKDVCLFHAETTPDSYNALLALGNLLSSATWRNQQYIDSTSNVGTVKTLGKCEALFDDRISFWLSDDDNGNRLGFFVAGGKSITTPYIEKEIELTMQYDMANFLTVNQPFNVAVERAHLERIGNKVIQDNLDRGYLDPDGTNTVKVTPSAEAFIVNGALTTSPAVALWRIKMDSYQTQG